MLTVGFAILAACFAGFADFLGGVASRRISAISVLLGSYALSLVGFGFLAAVSGQAAPSVTRLLFGLVAGLGTAAGLYFLYTGLAIGPMSVVAPIAATAAVPAVLVGVVSGESLHPFQLVGIPLAIGGTVLASSVAESKSVSSSTRGAIFLGIGAAVMLGLSYAAIKASVDGKPLWTATAIRAGGLTILLPFLIGKQSVRFPPRATWPLVALVTLVDGLAVLALVAASNRGLLTVVSTIASLYPVITVILAAVVLRERVRIVQCVGIAVALAGVCLLAA